MKNNNIVDVKEVRNKETIITEIRTTVSNVRLTALTGAIRIGENLKELKERGGEGRFTITGVRHAESARRKNHRAGLEYENG